ncbi:MAG TPA: type II secretion system F family protein [Phycisphaerales bacterium]|nr:type II secretion system F family protein [Phycisphaerales bacterium]
MKLRYQAVSQSGKAVTGVIEAADVGAATEKLYLDGLFVTSIGGGAAEGARGARGLGLGGNRMKLVAGMTRQLAVLATTGTPIVQAVASVERQLEPGPFQDAVADIRRRVEEGEPLSAAMEHHPRYFDGVYRSLVAAGESGGNLGRMLDRLSTMTRKQMKIRNTVLGAMTYPALLMVISVVVVIVMLTVVLPKFTGLFDNLGAPVPPSTKVLVAVSDSLIHYWWAWALGAGAGVAGLVLAARSPAGRTALDAALLRLPVIGRFFRCLITARLVRTLGVLMEGKVQLLDALDLTRHAAGNARYSALIDRAIDCVTRGEPMSTALRDTPLIAPSIYEAIVTGERSGQVGPILLTLSDFLDEDNEVVVKSLTSLLEPLILIVLGVVVGFVALSMFMPLFDLTAAAGAGG